MSLQMADESLPRVQVRKQHVEKMISGIAVGRHLRQAHAVSLCPGGEPLLIARKDASAPGLNILVVLELSQEEGREELRGQITRPDVHRSVLVDLTAEESAAVGAFLAQDLGTLHPCLLVQQQRTAFAARDVFRIVEA